MKLKTRIISLLLAALLTALFVMPISVEAATVEEEVFSFLTKELGLTTAAAAGIMANIMCECSFNPNAGDIDTNGLYSYGLVMWNGPRYERLKSWCKENGLSYDTVEGQMRYLKYELEGSECETLTAMRAIPDTFEGCVDATVLFAELFERCAAFSYGLRVYYAVNTFWPSYGTGAPSEKRGIYGVYCNYPTAVKTGDSYTLKGAVVSYTSPITELSAGVWDASGKMQTGSVTYPAEYVYDISKIDRYVVFGILPPGVYVYRISASNADGQYTVEEHEFTVGDKLTTGGKYPRITDGTVLCGFGPYCPGAKFTDMPAVDNWAHDGIDYVISRGLFLGTSANTFSPDATMTRAMLVTVIWRLEGSPAVGNEQYGKFVDVEAGSWYEDAVAWASSNGVTKGVDETHFNPYAAVTREEAVTFLQRFTESKGYDYFNRADLSSFSDVSKLSYWSTDAFSWAVAEGIIFGSGSGTRLKLDPGASATRAQVAAMLKRFVENVYDAQ
ncbi:MAG: S-layer homology domain-containing protein [Clostridia bacterium]|nr:S-layer homology domain-containing protein [Clostridia bacterium]